MEELTTNQAREYFKSLDFSYASILEEDIFALRHFLSAELSNYRTSSALAKQINMSLRRQLKKELLFTEQGLDFVGIRVKGSYFEDREAISFNRDKFIGFCGWADEDNKQPFIRAFMKWCDYMKGLNK